ncbi:MAG: protein dehydratase [Chloroflexi bacterium]|nr:protein dehydratase [Chloroflexota bacterium]
MVIKRNYTLGDKLPIIRKKITQEIIDSYALISGDHNPIHLDKEYAKSTRFKSRIAHGMITLAIVTEMLQDFFSYNLLSNGKIKTKFTAPVFPDEVVNTYGKISSINKIGNKKNITCEIGCLKSNGEKVIEGEAIITI